MRIEDLIYTIDHVCRFSKTCCVTMGNKFPTWVYMVFSINFLSKLKGCWIIDID